MTVASIDLAVHLDELAARLEHSEGMSRAAAESEALGRHKAELRDRVGPYRNEVGMYAAMDAVRHAHGWDESVEALVGLTRAIEVCETKGAA